MAAMVRVEIPDEETRLSTERAIQGIVAGRGDSEEWSIVLLQHPPGLGNRRITWEAVVQGPFIGPRPDWHIVELLRDKEHRFYTRIFDREEQSAEAISTAFQQLFG